MPKLIDMNTGEFFELNVAANGNLVTTVSGSIEATVQEPLDVNLTNATVDVEVVGAITVTLDNMTGIFSGQITVPASGTPVQGPSITNANGFFIKGHVDNTDTVWAFPYGQTKISGYPLNAGEQAYLNVANLNESGYGADVSGEKICWLKA